MENDILKAISQLLDEKLEPIKVELKDVREELKDVREELKDVREELKEVKRKQDSLQEIVIEIKEGQTNMEVKIDSIAEETAKLLEFRESSVLELNKVNEEIQFQAHKIKELEKVMFGIQNYLKIVK